MRAEIICIGTELLLGTIENTNASYMSRKLAEIGIDVYHQVTVGDNHARLDEAIRQAIGRADIIITSGGLGPTVDDITTETLAGLIGRKLVLDERILNDVKKYFKLRKVKFPKEAARQAYVPEGVNPSTLRHSSGSNTELLSKYSTSLRVDGELCRTIKWVKNDIGTAPGLIVEYNGRIIICLPGPPREITPMFAKAIIPYLKKKAGGGWVIKCRAIKTTGLAESHVNGMVKDLLKLKPPVTVGIYAKLGQVELKIMSKAKSDKTAGAAIAKIDNSIRARLKDWIFGSDDETLEGAVGKILVKNKKTIAVAESCTGGLVSNRLTNVSGSSKYFTIGIAAYSNEVKVNILGVSPKVLQKYGAVSRQVASEMACGTRLLAGTDIGIGITGIAGPTGGTRSKPVGLVYAALAIDKKQIVKEFRFKGSREEIKFQASQAALDMIRRNVKG
ncbi:MAG: competence/damage-inducible protein A [Candidatus Omnitrophota bacterium]|nr:competence/damage-inducible protein A [Candidatus Omnitrophota bacterium]